MPVAANQAPVGEVTKITGAMQDLPAYTAGGSTLLVFALPPNVRSASNQTPNAKSGASAPSAVPPSDNSAAQPPANAPPPTGAPATPANPPAGQSK